MSAATHDAIMRPRQLPIAAMLATACAAVTAFDKDHPMTSHTATGPFDVKIAPQPLSAVADGSGLGRMSLDKRFHGALEAISTGEMLSFGNPGAGSAGYVAMESVRGALDGRAGSFALQHSSTLDRGVPTQSITVVPGSGTDALAGLTGRMVVEIAPGGAHSYRFEYVLP
jgi:hypothetical protein